MIFIQKNAVILFYLIHFYLKFLITTNNNSSRIRVFIGNMIKITINMRMMMNDYNLNTAVSDVMAL